MGIFPHKKGYKVKSYVTGKYHRSSTGGIKVYSSKAAAMKAARYKRKRR